MTIQHAGRMTGALIFGATLLTAAPLAAQPYDSGQSYDDQEIVVTGSYDRVPDNADSASQRVSYADLDLSQPWARDELRRRVSLTARYLCDKLGESDTSSATGPSCRDAATRDALDRVGTVEENFAPRGTAWVRPQPWTPPYSREWAARYSSTTGDTYYHYDGAGQ